MAYRKDQGRYARMAAFWSLTLLIVFGCFHGGGLVTVLNGWMAPDPNDPQATNLNPTLVDQFPLLGSLRVSTLIAMAVVLLSAWIFHRLLNKPKFADALIDTETELRKVTWPSPGETWNGTLAVATTVIVLFLFLTVVDVLMLEVLGGFIGSLG